MFYLILLLRIFVFLLGLFVVVYVFISALKTFVLPRSAPDFLVRLVFRALRVLFNMRLRFASTYVRKDAIMAVFAPLSLLTLPVVWLNCVLVGYMGMFWGVTQEPLYTLYKVSGSSLFTLGFATVDDFLSTSLMLSEATFGLFLVALLIAYLPTMYAAFSKREEAVTMLEVRAGSPPSAVEMISRFHRLKRMHLLSEMWVSWEVWFVELEESHTSLPALSFYRSPKPERSWITAAGAVLDAAALVASTIDMPRDGQADLCIRAGYLALRHITDFFGWQYNSHPQPDDPISITRAEFDEACAQLAKSAVPLKADLDQAWRDFVGWRVNYDTTLLILCELTMAPTAPWSSDRKSKLIPSFLRTA